MTNMTELSEAGAKLLPALDALKEKDQQIIAQYLWERLDGPPDDPAEVRAAWKAEINRRVEEIESGKVEGIPAEEVFRRMREKYG